MSLFETSGNFDVEGADTYNACYGGTNAFLNTVNWIESNSWDQRYGIAIMTDIAYEDGNYLFGHGGGAVAVLIGTDGPVSISNMRASCVKNQFDFFKPIHKMPQPTMDLKVATEVYNDAFLCAPEKIFIQKQCLENREIFLDDYKYILFHGGNCYMPKIAFHQMYQWKGETIDRKQIICSISFSKRKFDLL